MFSRNVSYLAVGLFSIFVTSTALSTTYYVSDSGDNDANGLSLIDAFASVQVGIDAAADGDTVLVYPGTYNENIIFTCKDIAVCGSDPNNREVVAQTVIAGTQGFDTVEIDADYSGHPLLSGLTIMGGAQGIYCYGTTMGEAKISKCIIRGNSGVGIRLAYCVCSIEQCTIYDNAGTGISMVSAVSADVVNCIIYNNISGIVHTSSSAYIYNCTIANNNNYGISKAGSCENIITNSIVYGNGDDLDNCAASYSCIGLDDCTGTGNISADPQFVNPLNDDFHLLPASPCKDAGNNTDVVSANDIDNDGRVRFGTVDMGADEILIWTENGYRGEKWLSITGLGGIAVGPGGAFGTDPYISKGTTVLRITARNTYQTFATGLSNGGKIAFDSGSFGNKMFVSGATSGSTTADPIYEVTSAGAATIFFSSSTYKSLTNGIAFAKGGTFGTDMYVQNTYNNTLLRITPSKNASAFGSGVLAESIRDDLEASSGSFGTYMYMTHLNGRRVYRMNQSGQNLTFGPGTLDYCSMTFAEGYFGDRLFVGTEDGEIWALTSGGTATLYASGFAGSIRDLDVAGDSMWVATPTAVYRIFALLTPTVYYVSTSGSDNASGLTPQDAFATIQHGIDVASDGDQVCVYPGTYNESIDFEGKAITVRSTAPENWDTVSATIVEDDSAVSTVAFQNGESRDSVLTGLTITGSTYMGNVWIFEASPTISRCILRDNSRGISTYLGAPLISCSKIFNNGAGVFNEGSNLSLLNNLVYANDTGISFPDGTGEIVNCTVVANGDGINCREYTPTLDIRNCIIWDNGLDPLFNCDATYSCVQGGSPGSGNISDDPLFVDPNNGNYHLSPSSPCKDAGGDADSSDKDLDNDSRVLYGRVDMGADEISIWVADGYYAETWFSSSGMNGIAVGPGNDFGTDVYVSKASTILRITARETNSVFATGVINAGKIAFDSGSFGNNMFVSGAIKGGDSADPIYQVTSQGEVTTFFVSNDHKLLSNGVAFGKGAFGTDLYVQDTGYDALLHIDLNGTGTSFGSGVQAASIRDDLEVTTGTSFGTYVYMADLWGGRIYRMNSSGNTSLFSSAVPPRSLTFGEGIFEEKLYVGTEEGEIWVFASTGAATLFAKGIPGIVEDIDISGDTMWIVTHNRVYRITPLP